MLLGRALPHTRALPLYVPPWGQPGGILLPAAPGRCSEGQSKGIPLWPRDDDHEIIWDGPSVAPGGCSEGHLQGPHCLWLQEDAQPGLCSPALPCSAISKSPGDASHRCHRTKRLSQRDANPGQRLGDVRGCGVTPRPTGARGPHRCPIPPPPETVVCNVCASRGSAKQPSSASSVALGQPCSVLVRVVSPPSPPRCASCFPLPESGTVACLRALGLSGARRTPSAAGAISFFSVLPEMKRPVLHPRVLGRGEQPGARGCPGSTSPPGIPAGDVLHCLFFSMDFNPCSPPRPAPSPRSVGRGLQRSRAVPSPRAVFTLRDVDVLAVIPAPRRACGDSTELPPHRTAPCREPGRPALLAPPPRAPRGPVPTRGRLEGLGAQV